MRISGQMPRGNFWGVKFSLRNCCVGSCYGNSANRRPARATGWRMRICFCTYQTCAVTGWTTGMSRSSSTGTTSTPRQAPEPSRWVPIVQPLPFDLASPRSGQAFRLRFAALRTGAPFGMGIAPFQTFQSFHSSAPFITGTGPFKTFQSFKTFKSLQSRGGSRFKGRQTRWDVCTS